MKKYVIATLGCRTNQYESQLFADQLRKQGYIPAEGEPADLCIVNTCSVTDQADASSRTQIRKLASQHPNARLIVTGCMAENARPLLHSIDKRIEILPNSDKDRLLSFLFGAEDDLQWIERFDGHTRAFVKVQNGCNSFCSYCVIPYVRGRSKSRPVVEIVAEIKRLVLNGYREVVLTGINIGDYGYDGATLSDLVQAVDRIEGLVRLRVSSIDPQHVSVDFARALINGQRTCPHLHLVLQSGSDMVLERMNRRYRCHDFLRIIDNLMRLNSNFAFTTDVIAGFPGETDAEFMQTLEVIRQVNFAKAHVFPYSARAGTRASRMPDSVPHEIIQQRTRELLKAAQNSAFTLRSQFLNRTVDVLLEEGDENDFSGHTAQFLPVRIPRSNFQANQIVRVKLEKNEIDSLRGRAVIN
jgi:threonylcarbamoyladenosine tRNA methylthiotransferase MtaB